MKKIVYLIMLMAAGFSSCKEMDSTYKEYVIPNGITYPQRPDSLKIYPGLNRVKLTWLKAKDPKVVGAMTFWNNYTDSLDVNISAADDLVTLVIDDLDEGTYTFHVKTFDAGGNASVPSEITGTVYGTNYVLSLSSRQLTSINAYFDRAELIWGAVSNTMNEVSVRYESASGEFKTINVPLDETMTVITDFKPGGAIEATTRHLPSETALDPVVLTAEATFPSAYELSKRGWSIVVSDSLNRADTPGGIGIIDGDINVMWHSNLSVAHPHRIEIDMKGTKVISRFEICQSPSYAYTKIFAVRFSVDNVNWSEAVNLVYPNNSAANARQSLLFDTPVEARYARIETVENFAAGNIYAMIMEVYVYGHD